MDEEIEVIKDMLEQADGPDGRYGLQVEVVFEYVTRRLAGETPVDAALQALSEWDL